MQRLRNAAFLARLALVWFALSIGVAVAAPLIKPQTIELVCSGAGAIKLLIKGQVEGDPTVTSHTLDCPLCAPLAAPAPVAQDAAPTLPPLRHEAMPGPMARVTASASAPLPARGPPHGCTA